MNRIRDTSTKPLGELQSNERRKVIHEFYDSTVDTEKAYVDGLDLVYSASFTVLLPCSAFLYIYLNWSTPLSYSHYDSQSTLGLASELALSTTLARYLNILFSDAQKDPQSSTNCQ